MADLNCSEQLLEVGGMRAELPQVGREFVALLTVSLARSQGLLGRVALVEAAVPRKSFDPKIAATPTRNPLERAGSVPVPNVEKLKHVVLPLVAAPIASVVC